MDNIEERLGSFYVGQEYDLANGQALDRAIYYDSRDLTTHGVCLGMTGSGKTGLGVILLEEAALDGIPSLVIDPKGDMTNLLLTFPNLRPEDFYPWVDPDDARRKQMEPAAYAAKTADQWRNGLLKTGQGAERIQRLKEAAEFVIFTPGSSAGRQVSILDTFKAPALSWETDGELLREKIASVVSALLGLVGIEADPVRSREHILLSNILEHAWRAGEDLDLTKLILRIQKPPFAQLGVFPVDTFFPEKERTSLAMLINGLIASPAFGEWIQGQPLDIDGLLRSPSGKPQVSILYIAHLSEPERQFFVTLLLEQVVSWMRAQSGTSNLRALLYMDEVFGYLPPHPANPPTKTAMLTLLKQARAFGLGLILATQNPVDLDYKALSNAGTWFIGRMQADRDKQRLLDGLEGVQAGKGSLSRAELDRLISSVKSRVFLLHNVHQDKPTIFTTRWAMSYLRGPLTRPQLQELAREQAVAAAAQAVPAAAVPPAAAVQRRPAPTPAPGAGASYSQVPPQLPSAIKQVFLPARLSLKTVLSQLPRAKAGPSRAEPEGLLVYEAALLGLARLHFAHTKSRQSHSEEVAYLVPLAGEGQVVDWSKGQVQLDARDLEPEPEEGAFFAELPPGLGDVKGYTALGKEFEEYLFYNLRLILRYNSHVDLYSAPDEDEESFQRRCLKAAGQAKEAEIKKIKVKYEKELDALDEKLRREEKELAQDKAEHSQRKQEEMLTAADTVFSLFASRRTRVSSRLSTGSRKRRLTSQARAELKESEETIAHLEAQIEQLEAEAKQEMEELDARWAEWVEEFQEEEIRPRRTDVAVHIFAMAWLPHWQVQIGDQMRTLPAFEAEPVG